MIPTRSLAAQSGFFRRSAEELGRLSRIAWNNEALSTPTKPYVMLDFQDKDSVLGCKTMADRVVGGFSTASIDYEPGDPESNTPPHARFHGSISTKLPENWRVERTGYAAFRNKDRGMWLFGRLYWDVDPYAYLALRVKSDGRRYTVNVQTDSVIETDIHQHRLYTRHHRVYQNAYANSTGDEEPGRIRALEDEDLDEYSAPRGTPDALGEIPPEYSIIGSSSSSATTSGGTGWETVLLPFNSFVRTNHGYVVEPQTSLLRQKIKSIGIGLTDRVEGPFDLRIHKIWATNGMSEAEIEEERRICGPDALSIDEGVQSGWIEGNKKSKGTDNQKSSDAKGLKGLKSEWDE